MDIPAINIDNPEVKKRREAIATAVFAQMVLANERSGSEFAYEDQTSMAKRAVSAAEALIIALERDSDYA